MEDMIFNKEKRSLNKLYLEYLELFLVCKTTIVQENNISKQ